MLVLMLTLANEYGRGYRKKFERHNSRNKKT